ncbi:hypothetical protein Goshw_007130, partial [Gossypium schwendimanii]|nr:hypothetical protein [Gossypium lobatum]MBA0611338.1 hypothetical protein [Gossypium davidsonii]MBA0646457.1 hypothetical protein [Gossypium klotzschianum]MBA0680436.1 hypothetical protein [Gossypium aridum]MBA0709650.1 hypothetical protein [Gossypium laxum]MBA0737118.1 hypothetical protein [Gossypium gossypioides]MBA0763703.1 hypothetical protein [Gossypium trilobum]MBA0852580.1 hypothetical protein [Gossypium schwendimanii]
MQRAAAVSMINGMRTAPADIEDDDLG